MQRTRQHSLLNARGFSLIEIVVVLAIILLLMGIAFVALGRSGELARIAATRTTLAQLDVALRARYEQFLQEQVDKERKKKRSVQTGDVVFVGSLVQTAAFNGSGNIATQNAAQAMVKHVTYLGHFPQRWEDMYGLDGSPVISAASTSPVQTNGWDVSATPDIMADDFDESGARQHPITNRNYPKGTMLKFLESAVAKTQASAGLSTLNTHDAAENAELLYLLLTGDEGGAALQDSINPRHIGDTDNDGIPEFIDDWGNPIRFFNTPTGLFWAGAPASWRQSTLRTALVPVQVETAPGTANPYGGDPLDPSSQLVGSIIANGGRITSSYPVFSKSGFVDILPLSHFLHPNTVFLPLLVSAGPDGELGLVEPAAGTGSDRVSQNLCASPDGTAPNDFETSVDEALDNITNLQGAN